MAAAIQWVGCFLAFAVLARRRIPLLFFFALCAACFAFTTLSGPDATNVSDELQRSSLRDDLVLAQQLSSVSALPALSWQSGVTNLLIGVVLGTVLSTVLLGLLVVAEQFAITLSPFSYRAPNSFRAASEGAETVRQLMVLLGFALLLSFAFPEVLLGGLPKIINGASTEPSMKEFLTAILETTRIGLIMGALLALPLFLTTLALDICRGFFERFMERGSMFQGLHVGLRFFLAVMLLGVLSVSIGAELQVVFRDSVERAGVIANGDADGR